MKSDDGVPTPDRPELSPAGAGPFAVEQRPGPGTGPMSTSRAQASTPSATQISGESAQPHQAWPTPGRLPRTHCTVQRLTTACLLIMACLAALAWCGAPASALLTMALAEVALLHLAQLALLSSHFGAKLRSPAFDAACCLAAHSALALALLHRDFQERSGMSSPLAALAIITTTTALVTVVTAVPVLALIGARRDVRVLWLTLAAACIGMLGVLGLADAAHALQTVSEPVLTGAVVLLATSLAVALMATARRHPPVLSAFLPSRPRIEAAHALLAAAECLVVLVAAHRWDLPDVAVVAAVAGLMAGSTKLVVLIEELRALYAVQRAALVDDLTLLPNRTAVHQRILVMKSASSGHTRGGEGAQGHSGAHDPSSTLILFGLTRFKDVNDVVGRAGGDQLLRELADRLVLAQRPGELVARYGSDEFAVLLAYNDAAAAEQRTRELLEVLQAPVTVGARLIHPHPRAGVAPLRAAARGGDKVDVMRRAEAALEAAKTSSSHLVYHQDSLHTAARRRVDVGQALHSALATEQFVLHYQPQLDSEGRVAGVEALVRWQHLPTQLLAPDSFLPLMEELELQRDLSRWVLSSAVRQAAAWRRDGRPIPVSVNLSADDVVPELVGIVAAELVAAGLPADQLLIELTETTLVKDPERVAAVLQELVALGVGVSIDDYGTGYSSLMLLLRLPVSELKIDKSFVADLLSDVRSQVVVEATLQLAHRLGMRVVAEGVEDAATLAFLRAAGCELTQGWVHLPAVSSEALMSWLEQREQRGLVVEPARRSGIWRRNVPHWSPLSKQAPPVEKR